MASAARFNPQADWSFHDLPEDDTVNPEEASIPGAFADDRHETRNDSSRHSEEPQGAEAPPKPQRHYLPRTCRICLEEVLPTFEPVPEGVTSMFNPTPKVSYISADPESGRLIRPCKCRGSQAYVHEACLQAWRLSDNLYRQRVFWECPTCKFKYRLTRMQWSRWITSTSLQVAITVAIMLTTIFIFGFVADPIINLYLDPFDTITSTATGGKMPAIHIEDADDTWAEHFIKGLASLGLLGFVKAFLAMSPWHWWNLRQGGLLGGGRRGGTGRDRMENISWTVVVIGVVTFLFGVWKFVRAWTKRVLEKAGERVSDVQGFEDDDEDEQEHIPRQSSSTAQGAETRKTQ